MKWSYEESTKSSILFLIFSYLVNLNYCHEGEHLIYAIERSIKCAKMRVGLPADRTKLTPRVWQGVQKIVPNVTVKFSQ